jgi:hypothetical protein
MMVAKYRRNGITAVLDSSGFSLSSSSKYFDIRVKRMNSRKDFLKLHVCITVDTSLVLSFIITGGNGSDSKHMGKLLRHMSRIARCITDKAYSSRKNCEIMVEKGGGSYLNSGPPPPAGREDPRRGRSHLGSTRRTRRRG